MISHSIKLAEFRQAWINDLRKDIADYLGIARKWAKNYDNYKDLQAHEASPEVIDQKAEELISLRTDVQIIGWRIRMRINPNDNPHKNQDDAFLQALDAVIDEDALKPGTSEAPHLFHDAATRLVTEARQLLKREWEVTKRYPWKRVLLWLRQGAVP